MLAIRSLIFNAVFYLNLLFQMLVFGIFTFLGPFWYVWGVGKTWSASNLWLAEKIVGIRLRIEGRENMVDTNCIVAIKHQSFLDTFAFVPQIKAGMIVLKRELTWIPLFGWYMLRFRFIAIDRGKGRAVMDQIVEKAGRRMANQDRQLIIFPEGTRKAVGAPPDYKYGIVELYARLNVPVVPIAHLAGLYWPRRQFRRYPGVMTARILEPIQPGLPRADFRKLLCERIETACDELLIEVAREDSPPPFPPTAIARLEELGIETAGLPRRD